MKRHGIYNQIAMLGAVLLIAFMGFFGVRGLFFDSLALEQEVRCGIPAHTHSGECYEGHRRVCGQEEHRHNRNCYILLLEDNDINDLLVQMAAHVDNSLEGVISKTVDNALVYNANLTSPLAKDATLADVAALNSTVEQYNISPAVVLNEDMQTNAGSSDTLGTPLPTVPNGAQTLGANTTTSVLNDSPISDYGWANYYILLDGEWTLVDALAFDIVSVASWWTSTYTASEAVADVLALYNGFLHTNLTTSTVRFYVAANPGQKGSQASIENNAIVFEKRGSSAAAVKEARYVRLYNNRGNDMPFYSVTLEYPDGHTVVHYVAGGSNFVLPVLSGESKWVDKNETSSSYNGGATISNINAPRIFTAQAHAADTMLTVNYTLNFPTDIGSVSVTTPTLKNTDKTSATVTLEKGNSHRILDVSSTEVIGRDQYSYGKAVSRMFRFIGWRVPGTGILLSPNANTDWSELSRYAGGRNTLNLVGAWEYNRLQTASFYIRYDSTAADNTGGNSSVQPGEYTNELFAAFIEGVDTTLEEKGLEEYEINGSEENSFVPDQKIRAMYGNSGEGLRLTTFPSDDYIFSKLKEEEHGNITVEGNAVPVTDLNDNVYTIRWYVFKLEDKAWHVDGRLVKKEGILDITKTFAGNAAAIESAKSVFSITAEHNVAGGKQYTLTLQNDPNLLKVSDDGNTYHWRITGLTYGEPWVITENGSTPANVIVHRDYRVVDTYGKAGEDQDAVGTIIPGDPEHGSVSVKATTVSTDMDVWYPLTVNFTNIYHNADSIIIKKEDFRTGNPLGGAVFQLQQRNPTTGQLQLLRFNYDSNTNTYSCSDSGNITQLTSSTSGYYELNVGNFFYEKGNIIVQEVSPPYGYTEIADIEVGYYAIPALLTASPTDLTLASEVASPTDLAVASEVDPPTDIMTIDTNGVVKLQSDHSNMVSYNNGLLIVRNRTGNISVTVEKKWGHDDLDRVPVTMHLYANGAPVSSLLDEVQLEKVLTEGNWTATWDNLPLYANGQKITWTVHEVKIGDESCLSDFSFVNWLVLPGAPVEHYTNGVLDNITFTITNDTHRTVLYVVKTNLDGTVRLEGATFTLQRLRNGVVDATFSRTGVTNSEGTVLFDNLEHGDYVLTETKPPSGYEEMNAPIHLTLNRNGTVSVMNHSYAKPGDSAYTVVVLNNQSRPLPTTGGSGTGLFYLEGLLLITAAASITLFRKRREACSD